MEIKIQKKLEKSQQKKAKKTQKITTSTVDALINLFKGSGSELELKPEEIDWIIKKASYYSDWIKKLTECDDFKRYSLLCSKVISDGFLTQDEIEIKCQKADTTYSTFVREIKSLGSCIAPDGKESPIFSVVIAHNNRFTARVNLYVTDGTVTTDINISPNTKTESIKRDLDFKTLGGDVDDVTLSGAHLLEKDKEESAPNTKKDIIDLYIRDLAIVKPAAFEKINSLTNLSSGIGIMCWNDHLLSPIIQTQAIGLELSSVIPFLEILRIPVKGITNEQDKELYQEQEPQRKALQATFDTIIEKFTEKFSSVIIKCAEREKIQRVIQYCSSLLPHAPSSFYHGGREETIRDFIYKIADNITETSPTSLITECILPKNSYGPPSVHSENRFRQNRLAGLNNIRRVVHSIFSRSENAFLSAVAKHSEDNSKYKIVINEKLQNIFGQTSFFDRVKGDTILLYKLGPVTEIEKDGDSTVRVATLRGANKLCPNLVMSSIEGDSHYNFMDEDRYAVLIFSKGSNNYNDHNSNLTNILLIDNLDNFVRQTQLLLTSQKAGKTFTSFLSAHNLARGPSCRLEYSKTWSSSYDTFGDFNSVKKEGGRLIVNLVEKKDNSSLILDLYLDKHINNTRTDRYDLCSSEHSIIQSNAILLAVCPFIALDSAQVNHYMTNRRGGNTYRARETQPINYGNSVMDIQQRLSERAVRAFWKGIEKISLTGKSFKISPHGGAEVIEIHKDKIVFEDQVLQADNLLITQPTTLTKVAEAILKAPAQIYGHEYSLVHQDHQEYKDKIEETIARTLKEESYGYKEEVERLRRRIKQHKTCTDFFDKYSPKECYEKITTFAPNMCGELTTDIRRPVGIMFWASTEKIKTLHDSPLVWLQSQLLTGKRPVIGGYYARDTIYDIATTYVDQKDKDPESGTFEHADPITGPDDIDFNVLTEKFVDCVCAQFGISKPSKDIFAECFMDKLPENRTTTIATATIGVVKCVVSVNISRSTTGSLVKRWAVNDHKVRRDEINPIMKRAMCFENQKDYDDFIIAVAKLSLRARDLMSNGLAITVATNNSIVGVPILLEFTREGAKWQLLIRTLAGAIASTHNIGGGVTKFVTLSANQNKAIRQGDSREKVITSVKFMDLVKDVVDFGVADLQRLFSTGMRVVNEKLARSRQLLEETANMVKAEYVSHTYGTRTMSGYKVTGISGKAYLVCCDKASGKTGTNSDHGDNKFGAVHSLPNLQYVCIVDKSHDQMGYDIIVNRLLALRNDKHVAGSVTTLGRYTRGE